MFMYLAIIIYFLINYPEEIMINVYESFGENTFITPLCITEKMCKQFKSINVSEYVQNADIVM